MDEKKELTLEEYLNKKREYHKQYYEKNKNIINNRSKEFYYDNYEFKRNYNKNYRNKNKDYYKQYRQKLKEKRIFDKEINILLNIDY